MRLCLREKSLLRISDYRESDEIVNKPGIPYFPEALSYPENVRKLEKVGKDSYISKLALEATRQRSGTVGDDPFVNRLLKLVGMIILPIGIVLFVQQFVFGDMPFQTSVTSMVAAVIGMIPKDCICLLQWQWLLVP